MSGALVDRLFSRFTALYGAQKVGAMWHGADIAEVKSVWAAQIEPHKDVLRDAIQSLINQGREWPPTLPEFVALCRQFRPAYGQPPGTALMAPGAGHTDAETARQNIIKVRGMLANAFKKVPQ